MNVKNILLSLTTVFALFANAVSAADNSTIPVGVSGYDLVSYHQASGPVSGNGHHLLEHEGVTYLFANGENKEKFAKSPAKYLPAYGGYCAFGASLGKKFYGDPKVYKVVDNTLYLNLDKKIQAMWSKDIPGSIATADKLWPSIKNVAASEL